MDPATIALLIGAAKYLGGAAATGAGGAAASYGMNALLGGGGKTKQTTPGAVPELNPMGDPFEWFHTMTKNGGRV